MDHTTPAYIFKRLMQVVANLTSDISIFTDGSKTKKEIGVEFYPEQLQVRLSKLSIYLTALQTELKGIT